MVYAQARIISGEWDAQNFLGLRDINRSHYLGQTTKPNDSYPNDRKTCRRIDFAVPVDHRVKIKESDKGDKYLDLARELKSCGIWEWRWYRNVIGVLRTLLEGLIRSWKNWKSEEKQSAFWVRPEYWEESWRLEETCNHSDYCNRRLDKELQELEIGGGADNIQTTAFCVRLKYWEESWRLEETCYYSDYCDRRLDKALQELEIGGGADNIQTTAFCVRLKYWEESWRLEETCYHSDYCNRRLDKELEELEIGGGAGSIRTTAFWVRPEYWEESWRLKKLACTQNIVKDHQLMPVRKTRQD